MLNQKNWYAKKGESYKMFKQSRKSRKRKPYNLVSCVFIFILVKILWNFPIIIFSNLCIIYISVFSFWIFGDYLVLSLNLNGFSVWVREHTLNNLDPLNLLRIVLWARIWSIFVNQLCGTKRLCILLWLADILYKY